MRINIRAREIDLSPAIKAYVEDKLNSLEKVFSDITLLDVEVAKSTKHHKKGELYTTKVTMTVPGKVYRVEECEAVLYKSIDKAKDDLKRVLRRLKGKYETKHKIDKDKKLEKLAEIDVEE